MAAEAKLGKSLDAIIEENRKKLSTRKVGDKPRGDRAAGKPKGTGMRIDGARKPRFQAGKPRGQDRPQRAAPAQAQRGQAGGLAVRAAGIRKRSNRPAALGYDDMDTDDYGAPPPRQQGGGGGGGGFRRHERDVPRGNSDGFWSHDLYDDTDHAPARRIHQAGRGSGPAQAQGVSLRVSNLGYKVTQNDITELFETCGTLLGAFIHYDNSGRSEGMATVVYQRRPDAQKAIDEYNGVKLDGKELIIEYSDDVHPVVQLSSGKTLVRPNDGRGGAQNNNFRRAVNDSLPVRGMGGSPIRSTGAPSRPTGGASRLYAGGGGIGRGGGRPAGGRGGGINGRLRSAVGAQKTKEQLDAEMDMVE